ncbi:aminopeptidase [Lutispora saccharofermentans]|uniref:Aminopeptidase n=1 Tax=Lutispora saccharofermentans TaxID=3024236 RepID=A0ABT1NCE3_9FIRM|nr:aminopeptidase [Lutispora saccharofermentans]MCQ1528927.1 aminopeptidase [Lutispora saccharofermentans]
MNINRKLKELAKVIVKKGVVLAEGEILVIQASVEAAYFSRIVAETAFEEGASEVYTEWFDDEMDKLRYKNESIESLTKTYPWSGRTLLEYAKKGCCFVKINTPDPDVFSEISASIISENFKAKRKIDEETNSMKMNGTCKWTSLAIPSKKWAEKVSPELDENEAFEKLWDMFFDICRIDETNSVENWDIHTQNLTGKANYLTAKKLIKLYFKNDIGTDLVVELAKNHLWVGGTLPSKSGISFVPNIPTEEVATAPYKTGADGVLVSTKPLCHNGQLIDKFKLVFKNGKVVDFEAEVGYEHLKHIIETDENSCYLGEVALVPFDSPISNKNILFYNTLFDENASCHFALGRGYPVVIKNNSIMTDEEIAETGLNISSLIHVDFMVGSKDLDVIGYDENNNAIQIFKNGNWAF